MRPTLALFCLAALIVSGCAEPTAQPTVALKNEPPAKPKPPARATDRPANPDGHVLIVEYHEITEEETRWGRTVENFRGDLERLYALGYRPVTMIAYAEGEMGLPPGASPVIFTFDDSPESQMRLTEEGKVDPTCAVGIWMAFAEEHPDFPVRGVFYVLPNGPFGPADQAERKAEVLKRLGCELGIHTISHSRMDRLSQEEIHSEVGTSMEMVRELGFEPRSISYPYGITPDDMSALQELRSGVLVGAGPAPSPSDPDRNLMRLPRIQAIEGEMGLTWWLDRIESGESKPYVAP